MAFLRQERLGCALQCPRGRLAQLGERLPYKQEVGGSIPSPPINLHRATAHMTYSWRDGEGGLRARIS